MVWKMKKDSAQKAEQLNHLKFINNISYLQDLTKLSKKSQQWMQINEQEQQFFIVLQKKDEDKEHNFRKSTNLFFE